jgi:hypothetical protein
MPWNQNCIDNVFVISASQVEHAETECKTIQNYIFSSLESKQTRALFVQIRCRVSVYNLICWSSNLRIASEICRKAHRARASSNILFDEPCFLSAPRTCQKFSHSYRIHSSSPAPTPAPQRNLTALFVSQYVKWSMRGGNHTCQVSPVRESSEQYLQLCACEKQNKSFNASVSGAGKAVGTIHASGVFFCSRGVVWGCIYSSIYTGRYQWLNITAARSNNSRTKINICGRCAIWHLILLRKAGNIAQFGKHITPRKKIEKNCVSVRSFMMCLYFGKDQTVASFCCL